MKILEKYKLYKSVMKQKPQSVIVYGDYIIYDTGDYKVDTFYIKKSDLIYKPILARTWYYADIHINGTNNNTEFGSFFAKRLFEHGKKYSK